jgi:hypothetical protein
MRPFGPARRRSTYFPAVDITNQERTMKMKRIMLIGILTAFGVVRSVAMAQVTTEVQQAPPAQGSDYPAGQYKIAFSNDRPSQPYANLDNYNTALTKSGSGLDYPIGVSRHHIIPYNTIRDFFNLLWQSQSRTALAGKYFTMLGNHIPDYAKIGGGNAAAAEQASTFAKRLGSGYVKPGGATTAPGTDDFLEYVAWMPGNLFIGPSGQFRTDDPGENFETNAKYIIGQKRFDTLVAIRDAMVAYQANPTDARVTEIAKNLESVAQITRVQPLVSTDWVKTGTNKYAIDTRKTIPPR